MDTQLKALITKSKGIEYWRAHPEWALIRQSQKSEKHDLESLECGYNVYSATVISDNMVLLNILIKWIFNFNLNCNTIA